MTITTRDQIIDGLANNHDRIVFNKASLANTVAGQIFSYWQATGVPGAGAPPTTAAVCTKALAGAMGFTNQTAPVTSYIAWLTAAGSLSPSSFEIHDRLAHMGGLSGTVTTSQGALSLVTSDPGADRLGASDYSDVMWWLEIYTALGATGVNATVAVTYNDASTGNLAAVALGATPRAGRLYPLVSAVAGKFIRAVTGVTLSATTGTAGNFGITATRQKVAMPTSVGNKIEAYDWAQLGLAEAANDACLMFNCLCSTTSTGTLNGNGKIIHG